MDGINGVIELFVVNVEEIYFYFFHTLFFCRQLTRAIPQVYYGEISFAIPTLLHYFVRTISSVDNAPMPILEDN